MSVEWSFPGCSDAWNGAAPAIFGVPLPYERWAGSSLEYDFVPYLYAIDVLAIALVLLLVTRRVLAAVPRDFAPRIRRALGAIGIALGAASLAGKALSIATFWHPVASLPLLPGESLREIRPLRLTLTRNYSCRPSSLSKLWFAPSANAGER